MNSGFRVFHGLPDGGEFGPCAITIGNFDGVHIGHREIFRNVVALAAERGLKPSAMTFDPHPARLLSPEHAPRLLSRPEERCRFMREAGLAQVVIVPFTHEFSLLAAEEFARRILAEGLDARAVLVGENFRFGRGKGGDCARLAEMGERFGFSTTIVPPLRFRGRLVSSSVIRRLVMDGEVALAGRMLNRCYAVDGDVVPGRGVGSKQTVPTLNLRTAAEVLPSRGVYVTRTANLDAGERAPSVTNVGIRPTFDSGALSVETFLLRGLHGEAPRRIRVEFLYRLREEKEYADASELKAQILRDIRRAEDYFQRADRWMKGAAHALGPKAAPGDRLPAG
ncbi:MAG: bifunctional riboflavin kinase/FAD synthetase [Bryobacteraceae bacterium]|nr:bifunctional riboflavin kinase/FAD synthetase [Bryobacteraceae bacterium]